MIKLLPFETTVVPSDAGQLSPVAVALAALVLMEVVVLTDVVELEVTLAELVETDDDLVGVAVDETAEVEEDETLRAPLTPLDVRAPRVFFR